MSQGPTYHHCGGIMYIGQGAKWYCANCGEL